MGWRHARKAVRERIAENRQRYRQAAIENNMLEAPAIRIEHAPLVRVFTNEHFKPLDVNGLTRWLLLPQFVFGVRRQKTSIGPAMYCRACGHDIPQGALRIYFRFKWDGQSEERSGCVHHLASECGYEGI